MGFAGGDHNSLHRGIARSFNLSVGALVWVARLLIGFLVYLQGQAGAVSDLPARDHGNSPWRTVVD